MNKPFIKYLHNAEPSKWGGGGGGGGIPAKVERNTKKDCVLCTLKALLKQGGGRDKGENWRLLLFAQYTETIQHCILVGFAFLFSCELLIVFCFCFVSLVVCVSVCLPPPPPPHLLFCCCFSFCKAFVLTLRTRTTQSRQVCPILHYLSIYKRCLFCCFLFCL